MKPCFSGKNLSTPLYQEKARELEEAMQVKQQQVREGGSGRVVQEEQAKEAVEGCRGGV